MRVQRGWIGFFRHLPDGALKSASIPEANRCMLLTFRILR